MQPDWFLRSLRKSWLFLRRRGRLVAFVFGCLASLGGFAVTYAPQRYRAEAIVRPQGDAAYPGPLRRMLADLGQDEVLAAMAAHAHLELHPDLWDRLRGRSELVDRFEVQVAQSRRTGPEGEKSVEVRLSVLSPSDDSSRQAASYLAGQLIRADDVWRTSLQASEPDQPNSDEPDYRAQYNAMRSSAPEADGAELVRRLRDLRQRIAEAEISQASLLAREQASASGLLELDARVSEEATQAYLAHLDAERERARAEAARNEGTGSETPVDPRLARIARMEADLERMLATRTRRHPEVRGLVRVLEAERRAAADAGLAPVAGPRDGGRDPDFDATAFQPGPTPPVWRQRAPSYPGWVSARDEVLDVRQRLAVAKEELGALEAQRDGLLTAQARSEETQRELARLLRLAEDQERRAEDRRAEQTTSPPLRQITIESHRESLAWVGWRGVLFLSLLCAVCVGLGVDASDDSYRLPEEVLELGVPVLGVIPHLKGA